MDSIPVEPQSNISQANVSPSVPVKHSYPFVKILIGLVLLAIGIGIGWFLAKQSGKPSFIPKQTITTYEDCLNAKGSTVQESYPATCVTRDGLRFTQPLTDEEKQNLLPPELDIEQADALDTANWKTYPTSITIGLPYSFKYPRTTDLEEAQDLVYFKTGNATIYHRYLAKQVDLTSAMNNFKPWGTNEQVVFSNERKQISNGPLTGYKLTSSDGNNTFLFLGSKKLIGILVFHYPTIEVKSGQLLDQILFTFKFVDKISDATPTSQPMLTKISGIMPTTDWKLVSNDGVILKIPVNANCDNDNKCASVSYPNYYNGVLSPVPSRISVSVSTYLGGSMRQQYLDENKGVADCKPIYKDALFGAVNALQVAIDGGWCQGGYAGGILSVVGNKLVVIGPGLTYNENKEISRWDVRDTLVSTLSSQ